MDCPSLSNHAKRVLCRIATGQCNWSYQAHGRDDYPTVSNLIDLGLAEGIPSTMNWELQGWVRLRPTSQGKALVAAWALEQERW